MGRGRGSHVLDSEGQFRRDTFLRHVPQAWHSLTIHLRFHSNRGPIRLFALASGLGSVLSTHGRRALHYPPSKSWRPLVLRWYIILLVEDDDDRMLKAFKVHRGVLARQSEVFEAMFDIPQPAPILDSIDQIDGCPVVRMYDLPNELSDLIKALYDGV